MSSLAEVMAPQTLAGQVTSAQDADELIRLLNKHKDDGVLSNIFKENPMILAHALRRLDDDQNVLYKFLCKNKHIVGKFLEQHDNINVLAEFLTKYPAAMHQILDEERSIVENFLNDEPEALQVYLDAKFEDLARKYFDSKPEKFHTFICNNPRFLSEFCDKHPRFMAAWLENRQATVQDYLMASPAYFWNHMVSHPSCNMSAHAYGTMFTASFSLDIPEDQHDLIRLSIERCLPRDLKARRKALADIANRGESAILVEGYTERHNPWFEDETVRLRGELEDAAAEDERWLANDSDPEVPESLEWYPNRIFKVEPKQTRGSGPKSGEFPGISKARSLTKKNTETRSSRKSPVAESVSESTPHPFPPARAKTSQKFGKSYRIDRNQVQQKDHNNSIMPSFELDAHAPHPSLYKPEPATSASKKHEAEGRAPRWKPDVHGSSDEQESVRQRAPEDVRDPSVNHLDTDDEDEEPIAPHNRARQARDSAKLKSMSGGKTKPSQSKAGKKPTKPNKNLAADDYEEESDVVSDQSDSDSDDNDQDWVLKKGNSKVKAHTKKNNTSRSRSAVKKSATKKPTARKAASTTKQFAATNVQVGIVTTPISEIIAYPTPAWLLAEDDQKKYSHREWPLRHQDCAIKHMLAVSAERKIKGEARFKEANARLNNELGVDRTWYSLKNYWNRCGRERSGFDERKRKNQPMSTSLGVLSKKPKKAKRASSSREIASTQRFEGRNPADGTWLAGHPTQTAAETAQDDNADAIDGQALDADDYQAVQSLLGLRETPEPPSIEGLSSMDSSDDEFDDESDESDEEQLEDSEDENEDDRASPASPGTDGFNCKREDAVEDITAINAGSASSNLPADSSGTNGIKRKRSAREEEKAELELDLIARSLENGTRPKKQVRYRF